MQAVAVVVFIFQELAELAQTAAVMAEQAVLLAVQVL
jgi:hypothetical protein